MARALIVGNWKMHGLRSAWTEVVRIAEAARHSHHAIALCPPATLIHDFSKKLEGQALRLGAQDCHEAVQGAFTGDISAQMLADLGAHYVLVGHSERRRLHGETDELVRQKYEAGASAGLVPILCVGETLAERETGIWRDVLARQVQQSLPAQAGTIPGASDRVIIAYEPVWAIGSGLQPPFAEMEVAIGWIREVFFHHVARGAGQTSPRDNERLTILYGGSVRAENAASILPLQGVGGLLVGGASVKALDFNAIIDVADQILPRIP